MNSTTTTGGFSPYSGGSGTSAYCGARNLKLYRFTIKEEGVPVADFLPGKITYSNTEVPCLLDACNNWHPYFNAGTGDFICGAVTNNVSAASSGN